MEGGFWILVCLFASIGLVQAFGWMRCALAKPKGVPGGYVVLPLSTEPAELEQQLRYELLCRSWENTTPNTYMILVDNGLDDECHEICRHLLDDVFGVFLCTPETLAETLHTFNNLQTQGQKI